MEEFRKFSPNGARALIDERDAFIAHQLILLKVQRPQGRILAVVGAGHRQGISNYLDKPDTLPPYDPLIREPASFPWAKVFGFGVTAIFILLLAAIAFSGVGLDVLLYAFLFWVIIHGVLLCTVHASRRRASLLGPDVFLCCMVYLAQPHDPGRLDWCIC